jgi:endo-1,4-beta-D-glucanase Y
MSSGGAAGSVSNGGSGTGGTSGSTSASGGAPLGDLPGNPGAPFKFPQNFRSANCVYPPTAKSSVAQAAYNRWKTELVTSDGAQGFRRVRRPNTEMDTTVSEGIAYGMILALVMDDQSLFDELWKYSQKYLNQNGLMNWQVGADGKMLGEGAATDADEDMAWSLALADKKWGGQGSQSATYLTLAKQQIDKIWNHEVDHGRGEMLLAGDSWGEAVVYNPSYFAPNQYRLFGKVSGNTSGWNKVIDKGYEMLNKTLTSASGNLDNGLVPAWTNDNAVPTPAFMGAPTHYQYDSARMPFRIALDYCDFGEMRAKAYLAKTSTFFAGVGASKIVDGYDLNGTPHPENTMPAGIQSALFVGAAGVGAMSDAKYQSFVNDVHGLLGTKDMFPPSYYFNMSWQVFSLLMMTGNLFDYTLH